MIGQLNSRKIAAIVLHFFSVVAIVLCRTFLDQLFLSSYPTNWLPSLRLPVSQVEPGDERQQPHDASPRQRSRNQVAQ